MPQKNKQPRSTYPETRSGSLDDFCRRMLEGNAANKKSNCNKRLIDTKKVGELYVKRINPKER